MVGPVFLVRSQNLSSLLSGKNINATFSITAYDEQTQEWGIAVATNNLYVGNSTIYIEPGVGAFSVIAETLPTYGKEGLRLLKEGKNIEEAILTTKDEDPNAHYRQVAGLDKNGVAFAFTGEALKYWKGKAAHQIGLHYVVMGNQLGAKVLDNMAQTFENSTGTLAERLLSSLLAGQLAGGQISGKQSAALVVKGSQNEWFNQIDLRVDHSPTPFQELQTLLNYHYGRIRLNQAFFAFNAGNKNRAKDKLLEAEERLAGWNGMYSKLALLHTLLNQENQAIRWIQRGLVENPNWKVNLPAFYYLRKHPALQHLVLPSKFHITDWESAIKVLLQLHKYNEAIGLVQDLKKQGIQSSYLTYLKGKGMVDKGEQQAAVEVLKEAISMDPENVEARLLLDKIGQQ